ncbi:hypothetical protein EDB80DRAFT_717660 [Ilyonectria destructans]|nr:hypothetical protein EDB80DRAFT_717660 [Ilyonectria destructans]
MAWSTLRMAPGNNLIGTGYNIEVFRQAACVDSAGYYGVDNLNHCKTGGPFRSFRLVVAPAPTCSAPPSPGSADTAVLRLYRDSSCCQAFQTTAMTVGQCLGVSAGFTSFRQAAGTNLVGRGIKAYVYTDAACSASGAQLLDVANDNTCWADAAAGWKGIKLVAPCAGQPAPTDPWAVTLSLFRDSCCVPFQTTTVGRDRCIAVSSGFTNFKQGVGANLLGLGIKVYLFTDSACSAAGALVVDAINANACWTGGVTWKSFKYVTPPTCAPGPSNAGGNANTAAMALFGGGDCCTGVGTLSNMLVGGCRNKPQSAGFDSHKIQLGSNLLGKGHTLVTFTNTGCTGNFYSYSLGSANADICRYGDTVKSALILPPARQLDQGRITQERGYGEFVWVRGTNPCRAAWPLGSSTVCAGGRFVLDVPGGRAMWFEGCGSTDLNVMADAQPDSDGRFYAHCSSAYQGSIATCDTTKGDLFNGYVERYYTCV